MNIEKQLEAFIDENIVEFSNLGNSEVVHIKASDEDKEVIDYLVANERFDYEGICIYYVERNNEIWVENMRS